MVTTCPVCGYRAIGKVGAEQYYCWDCCVEFSVQDEKVTVFDVQLDGSLTVAGEDLDHSIG